MFNEPKLNPTPLINPNYQAIPTCLLGVVAMTYTWSFALYRSGRQSFLNFPVDESLIVFQIAEFVIANPLTVFFIVSEVANLPELS